MELHRLRPTSLSNGKSPYTGGRCGACDQRVKSEEEVVHLYGETFHFDCVFYRPVRNGARQRRRTRPT
jgi:hypothetical protein